MLVLSRYVDQTILIGNDIRITVLGSNRHGSISIGIDAPRDINIVREELLERKDDESYREWFTESNK